VNLHIFCQLFNPSFNYNIFQVLKGNFIRWQEFSLSKNYFIRRQKDSHYRKAISFGGKKIPIIEKLSHSAAKKFSLSKSYFIWQQKILIIEKLFYSTANFLIIEKAFHSTAKTLIPENQAHSAVRFFHC